jgi:hypothetical protein
VVSLRALVYDEAQFDAYRHLGESALESFGPSATLDLQSWFASLAQTTQAQENEETSAYPGCG